MGADSSIGTSVTVYFLEDKEEVKEKASFTDAAARVSVNSNSTDGNFVGATISWLAKACR